MLSLSGFTLSAFQKSSPELEYNVLKGYRSAWVVSVKEWYTSDLMNQALRGKRSYLINWGWWRFHKGSAYSIYCGFPVLIAMRYFMNSKWVCAYVVRKGFIWNMGMRYFTINKAASLGQSGICLFTRTMTLNLGLGNSSRTSGNVKEVLWVLVIELMFEGV